MLALLAAAPGAEAGAPTDALRDFFAAVNVVLRDPRTADQPQAKLRAIRRYADDIVDVREAAMLALGPEWAARTPLEQNEFVALFADLLERSFVWRVAGKASLGSGVRVDYLGEKVSGDTASVETAVAARDGNDFRLTFRMVQRGGRWVVRDIVMDGVSTMENYHAQFQRVVRDASWPALVAQLRAKVGGFAGAAQAAAPGPVAVPPAPVALPAPVVPRHPGGAAPAGALLASAAVDRPGSDLPHAIARDVAAAVLTPAVRRDPAPRDTPPPPRREPVPASLPPAAALTPAPPAEPAATAAPSPPRGPVAEPPPPSPRPPDASRPPAVAAPTPVAARADRDDGQPRRPRAASLWVQVGAFRSAASAGRVADHVGGEILVVAAPAGNGARPEPLLRVRVGPFSDRAEATARLHAIRALGYQPFIAAAD